MPDQSASPDHSRPLLSWESLDAYPHVRGKKWYIIGSIFLLGFIVYGVIDGSFSTVIVAILLGGMYVVLRKHQPRSLTVQVSGLGVRFGERLYLWNQLQDFWIVIPEGRDGTKLVLELHIAPRRAFHPDIVLFLSTVDPGRVRETLLQYLPERANMQERFLDMISRILKL